MAVCSYEFGVFYESKFFLENERRWNVVLQANFVWNVRWLRTQKSSTLFWRILQVHTIWILEFKFLLIRGWSFYLSRTLNQGVTFWIMEGVWLGNFWGVVYGSNDHVKFRYRLNNFGRPSTIQEVKPWFKVRLKSKTKSYGYHYDLRH